MLCPAGYVKDSQGCATCQCRQDSGPEMRDVAGLCLKTPKCRMYCETGYVMDSNGCAKCECNPEKVG